MTFPKRWLEDDDASSAVRDVLRAGRKMDPPSGAERAVWLALAGQIGAAGAGGGAAGAGGSAGAGSGAAGASTKAAAGASLKVASGAGVTAAGGGVIKAVLIGAFSGILAVSGYSALEPSAPPSPPAPTSAVEPSPAPQKAPSDVAGPTAAPSARPFSAPSSAPAPAAEAREPAPSVTATAASPSAAPTTEEAPASAPELGAGTPVPGSPEERESRLREENALLGQARGALRGGDPGRALQILEEARKKFPGGVLGQEREAVAIEALARSGAREAASARAAAFIKAHPSSPHAARLQAFVLPQ